MLSFGCCLLVNILSESVGSNGHAVQQAGSPIRSAALFLACSAAIKSASEGEGHLSNHALIMVVTAIENCAQHEARLVEKAYDA